MTAADRPTPANLAAAAARATGDDTVAHGVIENVLALVEQVRGIRETVGDDLDVAALARQSELLTVAHDDLSALLRGAEKP